MTSTDTNSVEYQSDATKHTRERYRLVDALQGGTDAMLGRVGDLGQSYLVKFEKESTESYDLRTKLAELEPVYSDTLDKLSGKPFSHPVTFEGADGLDPRIADLESNVDAEGTDITSWGRTVFRESVHRGVSFVLIDMPASPGDLTLGQEQEVMRPRWIKVSALDLIGWTESKRTASEPPTLAQVRIKSTRTAADGKYGEKVFDVIRVIDRAGFEVFEREQVASDADQRDRAGTPFGDGGAKAYESVSSGTHTFGEVPLYPFYLGRIAPMEGKPVLQDLADANLGHFRALSQHNVLMEHARRNVLFAAGFDEDKMASVGWGNSSVISTSDATAKLTTVGYQGTAHDASFLDLERRENRMRSLGSAPMEPRNANTATEVMSDDNGSSTSLQAWAVRFGRFLGTLVAKSNEFIGSSAELSEDFRAKVYDDFAINIDSATDGQLLLQARESGEISQRTVLGEFKRRGVISDGVDIEAEIAETEQEKAEAIAQAEEVMIAEAAAAGGNDQSSDSFED